GRGPCAPPTPIKTGEFPTSTPASQFAMQSARPNKPFPSASEAARVALIATLVFLLCVAVAAAFVLASDVFLVLFLGVLFGICLTRTSRLIEHRTPLGRLPSLGALVGALILMAGAGLAYFGGAASEQAQLASRKFEHSLSKLKSQIDRHPELTTFVDATPLLGNAVSSAGNEQDSHSKSDAGERSENAKPESQSEDGSSSSTTEPSSRRSDFMQKAMGAFASILSTTFGAAVNFVLIFFVGLFVAIAPDKYRDGVVRLAPPSRRDRTREILDNVGDTLWKWLMGRFGSMTITGLGAAALLTAIGTPLGASWGVVTGLLTFIPNVGGVIGLAGAMLLTLPQGNQALIGVFVGYIVLQLIESYVITPWIQQKQTSLPPALLISTQAVMGALFGLLGAAVASPVLAAVKRIVEDAYVHDVLEGDDSNASAPSRAA
ncbi:MAG: AI-2E family transporter, partial [Planctomycetales bacterium]|nr:AI-2E family transporter [Planctomycetales bacterium]